MAGQIDHALDYNADYISVALIGHNPPHLARDVEIEGPFKQTFRSVTKKLQDAEQGILITPVFGGETISGSSRMKGGSGNGLNTLRAFELSF